MKKNNHVRRLNGIFVISLLLSAAWSVHAQDQPPACDLSVNGSFESPNIQTEPDGPGDNTAFVDGWAVWRTTTNPISGWETVDGTVDILRLYNNASDGMQSIDLWGTAAATFQQTFTNLVPGTEYSFSVDYSGLSANDSLADLFLDLGAGFQLIDTLSPVADGVSNGNGGLPDTPAWTVVWDTFTHNFVATGTEATIRFVNHATPATANTGLFIDNFTFISEDPCELSLPLQTCSAEEVRATERWWYFGVRAGIDFDLSGTAATPFLNPQNINTAEGSTVVTDTSGQLQFWSNGQTMFDRNSEPMPNGNGLLGNFSATQTVAAFPSLTQPGRYFVVTTSTDVGQSPNGNLNYSVVDMSLNNGLGDVVAGMKNLPLGDPNTASEALTAVPNADGTGFWVLTYTNNSPNFLAYAFDGDGPVTGNAVVSAMPSAHHNGFGTINISADLQNMVLMSGAWVSGGLTTGTVRLLQFDAATGQAFQDLQWGLPAGAGSGNNPYSADFSPAGDYVYVTKIFGGGQLYRYDIANNSTGPDVEASMEQLGAIGNAGGQVRRAPDGRMYVAANNDAALSVVHDPDNPADPGFVTAGFALPADAGSRFGLPQTVTGCADPLPPYDFGDAPESYGTLLADDGARHLILDYDPDTNTSSLMLGSLIDAESDGFPSAQANGDDNDNIDDEDAFGVMPPININLDEYTIEVPVHNSTGADAVLVAWIDFNRNGQFDAGEAVTATVADGQTMATLSWTGLDLSGQFGSTYARLRIAPAGEIDATTPTGEAMGGEVEDYIVSFVDLPPPFVECPVSDEPPPVDFTIQERWRTPNEAGMRTLPYQTPVVGDLFGTGEIVAVVAADNNFIGNTGQPNATASGLHIIRGSDGELLDTIATPRFNWFGHAVVAIADVDGDGVSEIFMKASHHDEVAAANRGRLFAYKYDGTSWNQWWVSDTRYDYNNNSANTNNNRRSGHALSIADFNGDGVPEIFIGSQIFNAQTGERLAFRPAADPAGCVLAACIQGATVAVDMDGDGQLELVAGNVVYKVDLDHPDPAQRMTVWQQADAAPAMGDGFTAVADIDLDGTPDVVIVRSAGGANNNNTHLFVWNGQTGEVKGEAHSGSGLGTQGSPPLIGDIDGDGSPEIVLVTSNQIQAYKFEPGTGLVLKWRAATNDGSGQTSFALFDFNSNGSKELVYRDETNLRIIDGSGAAPVDLATFPCFSGTRAEMPVVAALDNTREARILVTCSTINEVNFNARGSLRAYETASFPWAAARPVWNQQGYFVAHVNDDLTIPANQFPHWTGFNDPGQQCSDGVNRPLNAFQQQVTDLDPNNGCPVVCAPIELSVEKSIIAESGEMDGIAEPGEVLTYSIRVRNTGGVDATDVVVNETVPEHTSFEAAGSDAWSCADGSGAGTACDFVIATVPADGHVDLLYRLRVDDPIPPGITGIANAVALNGEDPPDCPPESDPACSVIPTVPQTVVAKALTGESGQYDGQAEAGEVLTYTITLTNHGGTADTDVVVNEVVPDHTTAASGNQNANGALGAWSCTDGSAASSACDLTLATIAAGETVMLTFMIQVDDPLPAGVTEIANSVALNGEDPVPCPPSSPQCTIIPTEPAVSVAKSLLSEDGAIDGMAEPGETLVYELRVVNSGGTAAAGEFLREIVPQHTTYVASESSSGWDCPDGSANPAVCDLFFDIGAGETLNFLFAVQVVDPLPEGITRIANSVGLGGNPTPCPPSGVHCVVMPTAPDVVIVKELTGESGQLPGEAEAGETLTYTITLLNTGGGVATDFEVIDQLDPNVIFVSADHGGVHDGAATGGSVQWAVDVPGADDDDGPGMVELTVVVEVVAPIPKGVSSITNIAFNPELGPPNCQAIPAPPNCAEIPTEPPESSVMLSKALTDAPSPIEAGSVLTYTITATNTGAITLSDVTVTDVLIDPSTMTCPSVAPGESCELIGEYVVTQADIDAGEIINEATVTSPDPFDPEAPPLESSDTITTPIEPPGPPIPVPFLHPLIMALLGLMVMLLGLAAVRRASERRL